MDTKNVEAREKSIRQLRDWAAGVREFRRKRFCIIMVDYEYHVPRHGYPSIAAGLQSLKKQTFQDFNIVLCHDGPKDKTYAEEGIVLEPNVYAIRTPQRNGASGHHSRDFAMRFAYEHQLGEYYVQFNADNILYPDALEQLSKYDGTTIFQIIHRKIKPLQALWYGWKKHNDGSVTLPGKPAVGQIDCLQLVAHKEVWKANKFWNNYRMESDGIIYETLGKRASYITKTLGENF